MVQLSHPYMTTGKTTALTRWTLASKVMSLLFNMLSKVVTAFLPRSKHLLISWLLSPSAAQENKVCHCFHCFPIYLLWSDGTGCHDLFFFFFECWGLSQLFHSFTFIKRLFSSSSFSAIRVVASVLNYSASRGSVYPSVMWREWPPSRDNKLQTMVIFITNYF